MKSKSKKLITAIISAISLAALTLGLTACNKDGTYTALTAQADIFTELNAKTADVGILDFTMANYLLKNDSAMANNLQIADIDIGAEEYAIATRKADSGKYSVLGDKINRALVALRSTEYTQIAESYGLTDCMLDYTYSEPTGEPDYTEWNKVKNAGKIVIGFTFNAPMAIGIGTQPNATNGGFDTDLSKAVFDYINAQEGTSIAVEFKLISWVNKESEMKSGSIDCLWNGLTATPERAAMWELSIRYLSNKQAVLIRKSDADKYRDIDSIKSARIVAESGSSGEEVAMDLLGIAKED